MSQDFEAIHRFVRSLVRRERLLLLARVGLQLLGLLIALILVAAVTPVVGLGRSGGAAALVLVAGFGGWALFAAPLMVGWRRTGDPLRQARLVEQLQPRLEGRLLTSVERLDGPRGQESEAILGLIARRAHERLGGVSAGAVHRAWPLGAGAGALLAGLLAIVLTVVLVPGGPLGVVRFWFATDASADVADLFDIGAQPDNARVGDLVLEYVYPTYTGLDPLEVTNSTGEAHGPPGTQVRVRARSAEPVDAAAVIAYGEPGEGNTVAEERIISGRFTVGADEGTWHLEMHRGEITRTSRDFSITPEPDLAPVVTVDSAQRIEVPVDQIVSLPWLARDDYGLTRVVLMVDGEEAGTLHSRDGDRQVEDDGSMRLSPLQLGMSPGMRVELQIGAWDNNGWSGSQLGVSEPIELIVTRAEDMTQLSPEERLALRDVLVDLLAGQLMAPWPPLGSSAEAAITGQRFDALYEPLRGFIEENPGVTRDRFSRRLVRDLRESGQDFVAFTQVNFDPGMTSRGLDRALVRQAGDLRVDAVGDNEYAIALLDRYVQMNALGRVVEEAQSLAGLGQRLERVLERGASDPEIQSALRSVEESLQRMQTSASHMDQSSTRSMVERRGKEIDLIRREVAETQAAGKTEESQELAGRLARQMVELKEDLEYRMQRLEDEENELEQEMKSLVEELKRLEREQRQLQGQVSDMRQANDAQGAADAERTWAEVERLANEAADRGQRLADMFDGQDRFWFREHVRVATRSTRRLGESARARDLHKAQKDVAESLTGWRRTHRVLPDSSRRPIITRVEKAERLLDKIDIDANSVDPRTAAQARAMRQEQATLEEGLDAAQDMAKEVIAKMPIEPRNMEELLQQADENMGQARSDLETGRPMPAEGAQGQAAERLKEAREALEEAAAQMAQSGGQARDGEPQDSEGDDGEGADTELDLDDQASFQPNDITFEEEFDLDAFQRDVLRGMQGDVPESYRAMKKRYYEELMTQ